MEAGPPNGPGVRISILDDYQNAAERFADWSRIPTVTLIDPVREHIDDLSMLAERIADTNVLVMMRERTVVGSELMDRLSSLRLIVTTGPTNAALDLEAAAERNITVCGTGGYLGPTVELTWALILAVTKHVVSEDLSIRRGGWQHTIGTELSGRRLGVIGLGKTGSEVARIGKAFGMDVVAWSQNLDAARAHHLGVTPVDRDELLSTSDVISIHLVLSERTRDLLGSAEFAAMKQSAVLINTSRGPIVEETALIKALESGEIAGAGLDVFNTEPLPLDHPLRAAPGTVLTPHIGYVTDGLYQQFYDEIIEDIEAWLAGRPIRVIGSPQ